MRITVTDYELHKSVSREFCIAIAADLHNKPYYETVIGMIEKRSPDFIVVPGDLMEKKYTDNGLDFLRLAAKICPVFYSHGNHERVTPELVSKISDTGAVFLDNESTCFEGLLIGGLSSGAVDGGHHHEKTPPPDTDWLERFSGQKGTKLLINHHPEYYPEFIKEKNIDIIISGHAHGGQWRIFDRGVYAPGQGIFPQYTSGVHDGRLIISRGLANHTFIPRLFNVPELVFLKLVPVEK